jgi:hypothetical protein
MMLRAIGESFEVHEMDHALVARSIECLRKVERARENGIRTLSEKSNGSSNHFAQLQYLADGAHRERTDRY